VASKPARIIWSEASVSAFKQQSDATREHILWRVELLKNMPMMFQVEPNGRWAGLRRFHSLNVIVFYTYWHENNSVYIEAIVAARGDRS
jgi:hypothetical protein